QRAHAEQQLVHERQRIRDHQRDQEQSGRHQEQPRIAEPPEPGHQRAHAEVAHATFPAIGDGGHAITRFGGRRSSSRHPRRPQPPAVQLGSGEIDTEHQGRRTACRLTKERDMKNNTLAIALASLLVGGVAVAAFQNNTRDEPGLSTHDPGLASDAAADRDAIPASGRVEYADIGDVQEITEAQDLYAQVLGVEPVSETTTSTTPRQVCEDVAVQYQAPTRDPNRIAGTTIGAVVGGALGNQIGGGDGRKLATVGGAVGGAFAGRAIQGRQQANNVQTAIERECRTVQDTSQSTRVVAYNITY